MTCRSLKGNSSPLSKIAGGCALFSGVAVVTHIISGISLRLAVAFAAVIVCSALAFTWQGSSPKERMRLSVLAKTGLLSGFLATVAYDISRFVLTQVDPSPYNPFEAIRMFGLLLAGSTARAGAVYVVGVAFHLLNGVCFGIAYCFIFGRGTVGWGIAWGFFLELFQLTLYPGWLDIRFYREFVQISVLSHAVYGAVLGFSCQRRLSGKPV